VNTSEDPNGPDAASSEPAAAPAPSDAVAPTPFDGPWFLPIVLTGLALWFAYDGWFTPDESMAQWWWFNQGGALLFGAGAVWYGRKAYREGSGAGPDEGPGAA
jgi:hypothetical protein